MAKIISLFNNKGGVSKTTTTFHLGWCLAELGYKTLLVDTDPQCNLTGVCISMDKEDKLTTLYEENKCDNIKNVLSPVFNSLPKPLEAARCFPLNENNLFLLPGHIDFSEYDATYNIAENLTGSMRVLQNVPGALREVLKLTADKYELDYILIDMSPNISATNANILMQSDFFFVPCAPDYFCYMAIESLTKVFPRWYTSYQKMSAHEAFSEATYKIKSSPPKFIGTIQQRYRPRNGSPVKAFYEWIEAIDVIVEKNLVPVLNTNNMMVDYSESNYENGYNLSNISDFNSLIAQSQTHNTPVFLLTQEQVEKSGKVWENMKKSRDDFHRVFIDLSHKIVETTK